MSGDEEIWLDSGFTGRKIKNDEQVFVLSSR